MEWKLITKAKKRQRSSRRRREEERDRLSDLPDCVLLHIMNFLGIQYAVRTCVLSKRWKDLWKRLTNLSFSCLQFGTIANFNKFVSRVLSSRDGSISLHSLDFLRYRSSELKLLNRVMKYAVLHNVQHLTIDIKFHYKIIPDYCIPFIFSCSSLTFLKLSISCFGPTLNLPKSLQLPALKSLHLMHCSFTAGDNDCAEPFSICKLLNTLVIDSCSLHHDAKLLCISNSNLSCLTIDNTLCLTEYKIVLSTPNLSSFNIKEYYCCPQLSSTCNLSFLEEVSIDTSCVLICYHSASAFIGWLPMLANVKIMTLSSDILKIIQNDISDLATMRAQPPCFVRLESLNLKMDPYTKISDEEVNSIVEYLFQNSPLTRIDVNVINC